MPIEVPSFPKPAENKITTRVCSLEVPPPIPKNIKLIVKEGKVQEADDGAKELISNYFKVRKQISELKK